MTGFETARTVRYEGPDRDTVERNFAADRERAMAAGYTVVRSRWDESGSLPALVVDYRHLSQAGSAPGTTAVGRGRGGLGEAVLIAGVILAAILVLAAVIPTAAPTAPAASAAPLASLTPAAPTLPPTPAATAQASPTD